MKTGKLSDQAWTSKIKSTPSFKTKKKSSPN